MDCQVCNDGMGEATTIRFTDSGERISLRMCVRCRTEFDAEPDVAVDAAGAGA